MRLVELKCKNCGATIKVKENAQEATCEYCHSKFNIEKSEIEKALNITASTGKTFFKGIVIFYIIFGIVFVSIVGTIIYQIINTNKNIDKTSEIINNEIENIITPETKETPKVLYSLDDLTEENIDEIHYQSKNILEEKLKDEMFSTIVSKEQTKMYLISDETKNILFDVFKVKYKTSFGDEKKTDYKYVVVFYNNIYFKDNKTYYDKKDMKTDRTNIGSISVIGYNSLGQARAVIENQKTTDMQLTEK